MTHKDWNAIVASWTDEDLALMFTDPDLADRLRRLLPALSPAQHNTQTEAAMTTEKNTDQPLLDEKTRSTLLDLENALTQANEAGLFDGQHIDKDSDAFVRFEKSIFQARQSLKEILSADPRSVWWRGDAKPPRPRG